MNSLRNFCRLLNCYILFIPAVLTAPALSSAPLAVLAFVCSYFGHSLTATIITFFFALMGWVGMSFGAVSTAADTYGNFLYPFDSPVYLLSSFVSISAFVLLVLWLVFFSRRQKSIQNSSLSSDVEDVFAKRSSIIIGGTYLALFLMLGVAKTSLYALLSVPSPYLLLAFQILALAGFLLLLLRFIKMSKEAPCVNTFADTPAPSSVHASPSTPSPIPKAAADDAAVLPPSDPPQAAPETSAEPSSASSEQTEEFQSSQIHKELSNYTEIFEKHIYRGISILKSSGLYQTDGEADDEAFDNHADDILIALSEMEFCMYVVSDLAINTFLDDLKASSSLRSRSALNLIVEMQDRRKASAQAIQDWICKQLKESPDESDMDYFDSRLNFYGSIIRGRSLRGLCRFGSDCSDIEVIGRCAIAFTDCIINPQFIDDYDHASLPLFDASYVYALNHSLVLPFTKEFASLFKDMYDLFENMRKAASVSAKSSQSNKNLLKPILISVGSTVAVVGIVVAILFSCGVFQVASSANAPASAAVQSPTLETNAAKSALGPNAYAYQLEDHDYSLTAPVDMVFVSSEELKELQKKYEELAAYGDYGDISMIINIYKEDSFLSFKDMSDSEIYDFHGVGEKSKESSFLNSGITESNFQKWLFLETAKLESDSQTYLNSLYYETENGHDSISIAFIEYSKYPGFFDSFKKVAENIVLSFDS